MNGAIYVLMAILVFGALIALHELGHFVAAKLCGVRVNEFSVGMGPAVWQRKGKETTYSLRILPLGGYCAMEGEDTDTDDPRSFLKQKAWKRFAILVAGAGVNFLTGVVVIALLFARVDNFYVDEIEGLAPEVTQTGEAGLMPGDRIYKINGWRTFLNGDAGTFLAYMGDSVDIEVVRNGRHIVVQGLRRQTCSDRDGNPYQGFGIYLQAGAVPATFFSRVQYIGYQTADFVQLVWFSLGQLISGGASIKDLTGPVGIVSAMKDVGQQAQEQAEQNNENGFAAAMESIAYFTALIAVNLAVMNLLPLPALDGGRILFLLIDGAAMLLFRRRVPQKAQMVINGVGLVVLLGFMLMVTFQDIFKLVAS